MKVTSVIASIGQPITYYPALAKALESIPAAIFLAQLIYWTGKQKDESGWIYKSREEWEEETSLTRSQQESARGILREKGLIEEKQTSFNRTKHYRIESEAIEKWFMDQWNGENQPIQRQDSADGTAGISISSTTETTLHRLPKNTNNGAGEILTYLNTKAGRDYQKVNAHTTARLKEYSVEDLKMVIDWKVIEWAGNGEMARYLRQETLFSPKHFDTYLDDARRNLAGVEKKAYDKYCEEFYQSHMNLPLEERRGKRPISIEEWRKIT